MGRGPVPGDADARYPHDHSDPNTREIQVDGKQNPYGDQGLWSSVATLTGLPATAMPIARSDEGLPIGMQTIGPYLEDRTTIAFAGIGRARIRRLRRAAGLREMNRSKEEVPMQKSLRSYGSTIISKRR